MITYLVCDLNRKKQQVGSTKSLKTGRPWSHLDGGSCNPVLAAATAKSDQFFVFVSTDDGLDTRDEEQHYLDFSFGASWCYNLSPHAHGGCPPIVHERKDERGKSAHAVMMGRRAQSEKDEQGRSLHALRTVGRVHDEKDEQGRSLHALRNNKRLHEEKDKHGKSKHAVKMGMVRAEKTGKLVELTNIETGEVLLFPTIRAACRELDLSRRHVSSVAKGERKSHKGFTVRYVT